MVVVPLLPKDLAKIYNKVAAGFERKLFFKSKEGNKRIYVQILWNENKTKFKLKFETEVDGRCIQYQYLMDGPQSFYGEYLCPLCKL